MKNTLPDHLKGLLSEAAWPHPVTDIMLVETHISWVLLTGDWAYKIKRPVNFGFVDFSTLQKRHHFCLEEIRINQQYCANLYERVVSICQDKNEIRVDGTGDIVEYAVLMRQFPLSAHIIDENAHVTTPAKDFFDFGKRLGQQHKLAPVSECTSGDDSRVATWGDPKAQMLWVNQALDALITTTRNDIDAIVLDRIQLWCRQMRSTIWPILTQRQQDGRVRECHGDLHLHNLIVLDGQLTPFDGLEFDPALRWTDVCADIAFLAMDLDAHGATLASQQLVAGWLEETGDYQALAVLKYFKVYRALVRARVATLALGNDDSAARRARGNNISAHSLDVSRYLSLAHHYTLPISMPTIYVMRGLSGSGKSWLANKIAAGLDAVVIRSDVERTRKLPTADQRFKDYSRSSRHQVYATFIDYAQVILLSGHNVILDATFLDDAWCAAVRKVATDTGAKFLIIHTVAPVNVLVERIEKRSQSGDDASDATVEVLESQRATLKPLSKGNAHHEWRVDTQNEPDIELMVRVARSIAIAPSHS